MRIDQESFLEKGFFYLIIQRLELMDVNSCDSIRMDHTTAVALASLSGILNKIRM